MRKIAAVLALAGILLIATAVPSSAADRAENHRLLVLTNRPTDNMATACWSRDIYLESSSYNWWIIYDVAGQPQPAHREIRIATGNYTWTSCIDPLDGLYRVTDDLSGAGSAHIEGVVSPPGTTKSVWVGGNLQQIAG